MNAKLARRVPAVLTLVAVAGAVAAGVTSRQAAPGLAFVDINPRSASHGQRVDLASVYAGRGVVLQFVASWCKPCRDELPHLQQLAASGQAPVLLVAADEGPAGTENVLIVASRAELTVPILYVPPEAVPEVERNWRHDVLPATYFIDWKGRIRIVREGALAASALSGIAAGVIRPLR